MMLDVPISSIVASKTGTEDPSDERTPAAETRMFPFQHDLDVSKTTEDHIKAKRVPDHVAS